VELLKMSSDGVVSREMVLQLLKENQTRFMAAFDRFQKRYDRLSDSIMYQVFGAPGSPLSIIVFTRQGSYYCSIRDEHLEDACRFMVKKRDSLFSLYGPSRATVPLMDALGTKPKSSLEYYSMELGRDQFGSVDSACYDDLSVRTCSIRDFDVLKELQQSYHLEEVYTDNAAYPFVSEMKQFKQTLKRRINVAAFIGKNPGIAVAKANVNAESPSYYQVGGIYCDPAFRGRGIASACLETLLKTIFMEKENVTLFVKKENSAAVKLYRNCNFSVTEEMTLSYYM
jgi:ribosomal protein S18 acetylase RimI-like enzyme